MSDKAYSTYVMGRNSMLMNDDMLDAALHSALVLSRPYFSNWRILHIDGFEPMYPRARTGYGFRFENRKTGGMTSFSADGIKTF
jgi:hypothetical protein